MNAGFITVSGGNIFFRKWGHGKIMLIALHGYGVDGRMFAALCNDLAHACTCYAIDLPFHGQTEWHSSIFQPDDLQEVVNEITNRERTTRYVLLGHSFGARLALKLCGLSPGCERLLLLSPDGLYTYWLGWSNLLPLSWRSWLMGRLRRPGHLLYLAGWLRRAGWLPLHVERFLQKNLTTDEGRARLSATWLSMSAFKFNRRTVLALEKPVIIIVGKRDPMINGVYIRKLARKMEQVSVHELDGKHYLPNAAVIPILLEVLTISPASP